MEIGFGCVILVFWIAISTLVVVLTAYEGNLENPLSAICIPGAMIGITLCCIVLALFVLWQIVFNHLVSSDFETPLTEEPGAYVPNQ